MVTFEEKFNIELVDNEEDEDYLCFLVTSKRDPEIKFFVSTYKTAHVSIVPGEMVHTQINPADDGTDGMPFVMFSNQAEKETDESFCIVKRGNVQYFPR